MELNWKMNKKELYIGDADKDRENNISNEDCHLWLVKLLFH